VTLPQITFFAVPKPFRGHIDLIQRNAVESWLRAFPGCQVMLLADDEGTAEAAAQLGTAHVPDVARNEFGTPLLNYVFAIAQRCAEHDVLCYVNADIVLTSDLRDAVTSVLQRTTKFLLMGSRIDIDIGGRIDFQSASWQNDLRSFARRSGKRRSAEWIDYFVFPRGLYRDVPPFAIGRTAFDNWLLWRAHSLGAVLVDASDVVVAVHQNHDYAHHPDGERGLWGGVEAARNRALIGTSRRCFFISDATHRLTSKGLRRNVGRERFRRKAERVRSALRELTEGGGRRLRHGIGLRRSTLSNLLRLVQSGDRNGSSPR
jgi:hypothetical protein